MPTLYIIAGPNGAGKTTFARRFLAEETSTLEFVNADAIAQGLSPYDPDAAAMAAGRLMIARLRELMNQRVSFALETTLSGLSYRPWLAEMRAAGYEIQLDFLWLPEARQSIQRVARRVQLGGHNIPTDVIQRRHRKGLKNLFRVYRPLLHRWTLFNNTESPPQRIAEELNGNLRVYDLQQFAEIEKLMESNGHE